MPARSLISYALTTSFGRFVLVGLANTVVGLGTIYGLKWAFGMHDVAANVIGYSVGLVMSYTLNSMWSFSYRGSVQPVLLRYVIMTALAYLANLAAVSAALYWWHANSYVAQALGIVPYALVGYFGSKHFVFSGAHLVRARPALEQ